MPESAVNPLAKHFRQPVLYIKLPSNGRWYPPGSLDVSVTGEYPVYAMTAKDELALKTPDALLNGTSTIDVIQSCVPNIKDAWSMPTVDLDAVLIAIRQATYGNAMDFVSVCPHCNNSNEHAVDLGYLSTQIKCPDFDETVKVNGLEIFLKPQNYKQFNKSSIETFEQQRLLAVVSDDTLDDTEKTIRFNNLFKKVVSMTVEQITKCVGAIKTPDGTIVDNPDFITEFFSNADRTVWDTVKAKLEQINSESVLKSLEVTCENEACLKPYKTPLVFEQSSFFG